MPAGVYGYASPARRIPASHRDPLGPALRRSVHPNRANAERQVDLPYRTCQAHHRLRRRQFGLRAAMQMEDQYFQALTKCDRVVLRGRQLILSNADGSTRLKFSR